MQEFIFDAIAWGGYWGIAFLMFVETVFPPIPSELIIPFAGFAAAKGDLSYFGVVAAAILGYGKPIFWGIADKCLNYDEALIASLQAHVKGKLAPYEYPKEIEFIDALPMTTTGKVQRRVLRLREEERARSLLA